MGTVDDGHPGHCLLGGRENHERKKISEESPRDNANKTLARTGIVSVRGPG